MSPVCSDPDEPWVQLAHPEELARELVRVAGRYKTVGWEEDTQALNTEQMGERAWLQHVHAVMDQRTDMALAALDAGPPPLFVTAWTATDRVAHMFWRLRDPASPRYDAALAAEHGEAIEDVYRKMDTIVAEVQGRLPPDTTLIILSDHGFHAFFRGLHVNRWLIDRGYLVLSEGGTSLAAADWSASRAYSLGTGQVYLNLQGREGQGTVAFGQERTLLLDQIRQELLQLQDPATGKKVLEDVILGASVYEGGGAALAPDLQLAYADGYQSSWATKLGGAPPDLFEDNPKKWSGDHAASWAGDTHGVLFSSRKLEPDQLDPGIEDVAPTVLIGLGVAVPATMDGEPFLPAP
jgi:predicted AlkP superfamily phosphohydrolase/phosphomutase